MHPRSRPFRSFLPSLLAAPLALACSGAPSNDFGLAAGPDDDADGALGDASAPFDATSQGLPSTPGDAGVPPVGDDDASSSRDAGSTGLADADADGTAASDAGFDAADAGSPTDAQSPSDAQPPPVDASAPDTSVSTSCGGVPACRYGQACVAGACQYTACVGAHVPGDYATFDAAVAAMSATGGTICLGAGDFSHPIVSGNPWSVMVLAHDLTIVGVSAALTSIGAWSVGGPAAFTLKGVSAQALSIGGQAWLSSVTIEACDLTDVPGQNTQSLTLQAMATATVRGSHIHGSDPAAAYWSVNSEVGTQTVLAEENDVEAYFAVNWDLGNASASNETLNVTVRNNWFHGIRSPYGAIEIGSGLAQGGGHILIENNTFDGNVVGIELGSGSAQSNLYSWPVTVANNIFSNHTKAAVDEAILVSTTFLQTNNAFFGNAANYAGSAVPGAQAVTADCHYTSSRPPRLATGSPCLRAGDPAYLPPTDYWDQPRGSTVDLGAVASP